MHAAVRVGVASLVGCWPPLRWTPAGGWKLTSHACVSGPLSTHLHSWVWAAPRPKSELSKNQPGPCLVRQTQRGAAEQVSRSRELFQAPAPPRPLGPAASASRQDQTESRLEASCQARTAFYVTWLLSFDEADVERDGSHLHWNSSRLLLILLFGGTHVTVLGLNRLPRIERVFECVFVRVIKLDCRTRSDDTTFAVRRSCVPPPAHSHPAGFGGYTRRGWSSFPAVKL